MSLGVILSLYSLRSTIYISLLDSSGKPEDNNHLRNIEINCDETLVRPLFYGEMSAFVTQSERQAYRLEFSESQRQLRGSGNQILLPKIFLDINFQSTCVRLHNYPFNRTGSK